MPWVGALCSTGTSQQFAFVRNPGSYQARQIKQPFAVLTSASCPVSPGTRGCGQAVSRATGQHRSLGGLLSVHW